MGKTAKYSGKESPKEWHPVTTDRIGHAFTLAFPHYKGRVMALDHPMECGCTWVHAPDITRNRIACFALKYANRNCRHWGMLHGSNWETTSNPRHVPSPGATAFMTKETAHAR